MHRIMAGLFFLSFAASAAQAASVPADEQALVARVVAKMSMESVALAMLQKPIANQVEQARVVAQSRIADDAKREALLKQVGDDAARAFNEEAPLVRASAKKAVDEAVGPLLAQHFSKDELKQLADMLESPVLAKFEALTPELKKTVGENVARADGAKVQAKLTELQKNIGLRLRAAIEQ